LVHDTEISEADKKATLLDFDQIFGFGLAKLKADIIPEDIIKIAEERNGARLNKDWAKSDELRKKINDLGYEVKDAGDGFKITKI
jgi:cysteinyl-tRNA synthetase